MGGHERVAMASGPRYLRGMAASTALTLLFQHHFNPALALDTAPLPPNTHTLEKVSVTGKGCSFSGKCKRRFLRVEGNERI